jgi:Helicase associated domain
MQSRRRIIIILRQATTTTTTTMAATATAATTTMGRRRTLPSPRSLWPSVPPPSPHNQRLLYLNVRIYSTAAATTQQSETSRPTVVVEQKQEKYDDDDDEKEDGRFHTDTKYTVQWNRLLDKLKEYQQLHGDCLVPKRYVCDDGTRLGNWVAEQRQQLLRVVVADDGDDDDHENDNHPSGGVSAATRRRWLEQRRRRRALDAMDFIWQVRTRGRQPVPGGGGGGGGDDDTDDTDTSGHYGSAADRFNARWQVMYEKLKEYQAEHGHCLVSYRYQCAKGTDDDNGDGDDDDENNDGVRLGAWVSQQRVVGATDRAMSVQRRQALDALGFVWDVREQHEQQPPLQPRKKRERSAKQDAKWHDMFQRLVQYRDEHGDCLVPIGYVTHDNHKLGDWVGTQRRVFGATTAAAAAAEAAAGGGNNDDDHRHTDHHQVRPGYEDRFAKLRSIGFVFRAMPDDSIDAHWNRLFDRLVEYQRRHGDCLVPNRYPDDPELGHWVQRLRKSGGGNSNSDRAAKAKASSNKTTTTSKPLVLPQDQRRQLDSIGFEWHPHETTWQSMFRRLQQFQRQFGHCSVSKQQHDADYPGLRVWIHNQRLLRRRLDPRRIEQLESIVGFAWNVNDAQWQVMYGRLCAYHAQHGDCRVPYDYKADMALVRWTRYQRTVRDQLAPERLAQLDALGYDWSSQRQRRDQQEQEPEEPPQ